MLPARLGARAGSSERKASGKVGAGHLWLRACIAVAAVLVMWSACLLGVLEPQLWTPLLAGSLAALSRVLPEQWMIDPAMAPVLADRLIERLLALMLGVIPVLGLELCLVGYGNSSLRRLTTDRSASGSYDLVIFALYVTGLWRFWGVLGTLGGGYVVGSVSHHLISAISGWRLQIDTGFVALNLVLYLLAFTFFDYWTHWLLHRKPFWYLHRMHHSATSMTVVSLYRNHPGVVLVEPLTKLLPLAFFAVPTGYIIAIAYLVIGYGFLIHSNVRWSWGWFGRWVLLPPLAHRMHHTINDDYVGTMLGITPLWDRLFGTWRPLDATEAPLGVTDAEYNSGRFLSESWRDLRAFGAALLEFWPRKAVAAPTESADGRRRASG